MWSGDFGNSGEVKSPTTKISCPQTMLAWTNLCLWSVSAITANMCGPRTRTCIATYIDIEIIEHEGARSGSPEGNQLTNKTKVKKAIDELFRIRQEIKMLKSDDSEMAASIKLFMLENKLDAIEGTLARAELSIRPYVTVDPEAYFDAIDQDIEKLLATATIRLDPDKEKDRPGARSYLGADTIKEITVETQIPVLNIKKQKGTKKKTPKVALA